MEDSNNAFKNQVFTREIKAGKKRRYYIDVKKTRRDDYYLSITESKRMVNPDRLVRHKIFLYKEDFNKFQQAIQEAIDHVKNELLPEYDFGKFDRPIERPEQDEDEENRERSDDDWSDDESFDFSSNNSEMDREEDSEERDR